MLDIQSGLAVLHGRRTWADQGSVVTPNAARWAREHARPRRMRPASHLLPVALESEDVSDVASARDPYAVFASALQSGRLIPAPAPGRRRAENLPESSPSIDEMVSLGAEEPLRSRRRRRTP
jgi:hypothetical protein